MVGGSRLFWVLQVLGLDSGFGFCDWIISTGTFPFFPSVNMQSNLPSSLPFYVVNSRSVVMYLDEPLNKPANCPVCLVSLKSMSQVAKHWPRSEDRQEVHGSGGPDSSSGVKDLDLKRRDNPKLIVNPNLGASQSTSAKSDQVGSGSLEGNAHIKGGEGKERPFRTILRGALWSHRGTPTTRGDSRLGSPSEFRFW